MYGSYEEEKELKAIFEKTFGPVGSKKYSSNSRSFGNPESGSSFSGKGGKGAADSGLPANVIAQTPKMLRRSKLPIVKAKVGPKVMTLICDGQIFDSVPVKKEVKATVSGLYITAVKGMRGPIEVPAKKKKGFMAKLKEKAGK